MIPNRKALVFIGLPVIAGTVQAATSITTCPFVITSPGDYVLRADLICGGGDGITINTGNVRLALEGHTITAGAGGVNIAIYVQGAGATMPLVGVRILGPGLITNGGGNTFLEGVRLLQVSNAEVSGITLLGSSSAGINASGGNFGSTGLTLTANTLGRNGTGISVTSFTSSTISKNDVSGNGTGIRLGELLTGAPAGTVSHNVLNGNSVAGLEIDFGFGFTVQNNVINGNGQYGIFVPETFEPVPSGEIINNTSLANGMFDLFEGSNSFFPPCSTNVWSGNTFFTANQSCIH
jgi:hypothetical protein